MLNFLLQNWFPLALIVTTLVGVVAFINKIFAKRKYDQKFSAMVLYGIMLFISLISLIIFGVQQVSIQNIVLATLFGIQIYSYSLIMMTVLRYLPTSTYFVNVRLISSFSLLAIGIIFFNDIISNTEIIGFVLGVIAMILLFEKEEKEGLDYKKGILFLFLGVISLIFGHTTAKILSFDLIAIPTILSITFLASFAISVLVGHKTIKENKKVFHPIFLINSVQAVLYFAYFVLLFYVYEMGDLGISYKIQSYSPFIPIILAAVVYKEKLTNKKKLALVLTVISLWFFA